MTRRLLWLRGWLVAWLAALGPWRLAFAGLTALLLSWAGPQLAAIRHPRLDERLLDGVHRLIPEPLGNLLLRVYQMSGVHLTAVLVLADGTIIKGMAASMQVTSMPSIFSMRCPVGNNCPVTAPQASKKLSNTGAAVPTTPSMRAEPS